MLKNIGRLTVGLAGIAFQILGLFLVAKLKRKE